MSSHSEPEIRTRWAEGLVLLGILGAGVAMLQDLLLTMPVLCACILTFHLGMNLTLLFGSPSDKKDSRDEMTENRTLPFFQLEYQQELERARKIRKKPIWKSPEGPYAFYSMVILLIFIIDVLVLGLILMQIQHFEDPLFRALGCICVLMVSISALGGIKQYSYVAPTLLHRPFPAPTVVQMLYRRSYRSLGLAYCFYAIALMFHLI